MSTEQQAAPRTVGELRQHARDATSPAVERAVGRLLGASAAAADAAVVALRRAERLGDGLAVCALVLAARRGLDAATAVADLAAGRPLPEGWSDFELRAAGEEAAEELQVVLHGPRRGTGEVLARGPDAPSAVVALVRREAPEGAVVLGAAAAHLRDDLTLLRAVVDHGWASRLAVAAGLPVKPRAGAESLQALLDHGPAAAPLPAGAGRGEHEVCRRSGAHLPLLPVPGEKT